MSILIILIAAWGTGAVCLGRLAFRDSLEMVCFRVLFGLVPVAAVALVAGSYSLALAQYLLAGLAAAGVLIQFRSGSRTAGRNRKPFFAGLNRVEQAASAALLGAWLLTLISAVAPSTSWDAAVAHLALPSDYARAGRIFLHPGNVYSGYPHFIHGLYAVAFYNGHGGYEVLVSLLNWCFGCLACLAVYCLGARTGTRQTGLVAGAILATAPIYMDQAGGVGIDMPFAAFSTAALAALAAWRDERRRHWLLVAGFLAGASCGIRHTGYLVCLLMAVGVAAISFRRGPVKALAAFAGLSALAAAPWFLRSWLLLGNPVFPFLLSVFPAAPIDHIAITMPGAHESIERSQGLGLLAFLRFPWDIVMRPHQYDGWNKSPGGLILILGVPGLVLGGGRAWWLGGFSAAGGTVFFFFQRLARYLLPFFTPMMVVAALAVEELPRSARRPVAELLVFAFVYGLALHAAAMHFKAGVVFGLQTRTAYLESRVERYAAFEYANQHLNDGGTLLTVDQRSYYVDGPTYQNHWSLKKIAAWPLKEQVTWLHDHGIRYVMIPRDFVEESGALSGEIAAMLARWERSPASFTLVDAPLVIPRRNGGGVEEVAFYAVR